MTATESSPTMAADGVNFVYEDDAGSILFALLKEIANAASAHADKHFHGVRTGDREKGNVGFAGDRACKQSLSRSRRPDEQHALGNAAAEFLEFLRIFEELDNLLQLFFGFVGSRHIFESGFFLLRGKQTRAGFAEAEGLITARLHLAHQEKTEAHEQDKRSSVQQNKHPVAAPNFFDLHRDAFVAQLLCQVGSGFLEDREMKFVIGGPHGFALQLVAVGREIERDFLHVTGVDLGHELAVAGLIFARLRAVGGHQLPKHHAKEYDRNPKKNSFCSGTRIHVALAYIPKKIYAAFTATLLLSTLGFPRGLCAVRQLAKVATGAVGRRQPIPYPYFLRCSFEAKVIRLKIDAPLFRLIEQNRQAYRARGAFTQTAQQKFLRHATLENRIDQKNIPAFQVRYRAEQNFPPRAATVVNVAQLFANEVADHRAIQLSNQIRGEHKSSIQGNHDVQPAALVSPRNFLAQLGYPPGDTRLGKGGGPPVPICFDRLATTFRASRLAAAHNNFSSTITIPVLVPSWAANLADAPKVRDQAKSSPRVPTAPLSPQATTR